MKQQQEGLTKMYNCFQDPGEKSEDIEQLRTLHVEMDCVVAATYGWDDLKSGHGFHQTKQGLRSTISEPAIKEVLGRLLALNLQRYAEEAEEEAQGLHDKCSKGKKGRAGGNGGAKAGAPVAAPGLFDEEG